MSIFFSTAGGDCEKSPRGRARVSPIGVSRGKGFHLPNLAFRTSHFNDDEPLILLIPWMYQQSDDCTSSLRGPAPQKLFDAMCLTGNTNPVCCHRQAIRVGVSRVSAYPVHDQPHASRLYTPQRLRVSVDALLS